MPIAKCAWRNLGRNPKRTGITLAAVAMTTAVLIASFGLLQGLILQLAHNATSVTLGEVQVHAPGYLVDRSMYVSIENSAEILEAARKIGVGAAPRSYAIGLAAHGPATSGALFYGVNPESERGVFSLPERVGDGRFLADSPGRGVVLGCLLAGFLDVAVGSEVVILAQAADGSLANDLFAVIGILSPSGTRIDQSAAFLHKDDFEELFVSGGRIHEIALTSKGRMPPEHLAAYLQAEAPGAEIRTWRELLPVYSDIVRITTVTLWVFAGVFLLAGGLCVMNTMLTAAHERFWEFGLMKALGTPPESIAAVVAAEALFLCTAAAAAGGVLGTTALLILQHTGINLGPLSRNFPMANIIFDPVWRPVFRTAAVLLPAVLMSAVGLLASLFPAVWAASRDPVRTLVGEAK